MPVPPYTRRQNQKHFLHTSVNIATRAWRRESLSKYGIGYNAWCSLLASSNNPLSILCQYDAKPLVHSRHWKESREIFMQHAVHAENMITGLCVWHLVQSIALHVLFNSTYQHNNPHCSHSSGCLLFGYLRTLYRIMRLSLRLLSPNVTAKLRVLRLRPPLA
jgi:hypothetical protein